MSLSALRRIAGLTAVLLLAAVPAACDRNDDTSGHTGAPALRTVTIPVEGMTCGSCEQGIRHEVGRLLGVSEVTASHQAKRATVTFDPNLVTVQTVRETIDKLGYKTAAPVPSAAAGER